MILIEFGLKNLFRIVGISAILLLGARDVVAQSNVVPDAVELQVLKNIYDSLGGTTWTNKSGWPTPGNWPATATAAQMDAWHGVVVSNGDITGFSMTSNGLTGQIPKTIAQLSKLSSVRFDYNQIAGTLPASLGSLTSLVTFNVSANKLTGPIPGSLNNLTSLTYLHVSNNLFTGDIPYLGGLANLWELQIGVNNFNPGPVPAWISELSNLRVLVLANCYRNGSIPTSIGTLSNLTNLQLQSNQLTGSIPAAIGNLGSLQRLYLNGNQLSGSIPASIGNLSALQTLSLYSNQLSGSIPVSIGNLSNLAYLSLSSNQLSGIIPPQIGNLTKLTDIFLHVNKLEGSLPASIGNLNKLVNLYIYGNKLTGSLPTSLGNLTQLVSFFAYGNAFTGSIPAELGNLTNLAGLQLNSNQLSGTIPSELGNLTKLTQLYLNNNKLTGPIPSSLGNLINLNRLYLSNNQLTGELPSSLGNLTKMAYFYGGANQLVGTIPASFANWSQIYLFDIGGSSFSGPLPDNLFSTWTKIVTLNIGINNFTGAFPSSISGCTLLTSLTASINKFSSLPSSILTLPVATSISFDNNELTSIPNFGNHVNKANLTLTVASNRLDFAQLEPLVGVGIKTLGSLVQKTINDVGNLSMTVGSDVTLTARPKGSFTNNLKWEKLQANNTWLDISSSNADPITGVTYRIANATATQEGTYRWSATSTKAPGVTITSDLIGVKTPQRFALDNLSFQYRYDGRRRMTHKKVPGADWVYMVYDNRDRLVLTQDGEQRKANRWTFTKYDALNRPVMTGIFTHTVFLDQKGMQDFVNAYYSPDPLPVSKSWFETIKTTAGNVLLYDNKSFPAATEASALTVTYYDNYDFRPFMGAGYSYIPSDAATQVVNEVSYNQPISASNQVVGLVTGTKVKVLNTGLVSGAGWLNNVTYYDEKYRVVQTIADNQKGGKDRITNVIDFVGKVLYTKSTHLPGDIQWKDVLNVSIGNEVLTNSYSTSSWIHSGAASVQSLAANTDGWMEVTVSETNTARMIGFSERNADANYTSIDYALYMEGNSRFEVYEKGTQKNTVPMVSGDVLRLERVGSAIRYLKNGVLVYTSTVPSTSSLVIDMSLHTPGATLRNIRTSFAQPIQEKTIARKFTYDHAGRLLKTFHSVNGAEPVLLAQNEYNELGQLVDKKLHSTDPENTPDANRQYKQSVDYRYNIRGWLTHINNAQLANNTTNDDTGDLFGMNLNYNDLVEGLTTTGDEQYNGNISAISYSANQGVGTIKERGYKFGYDPMNRLLSATHKEKSSGWNTSSSFHEDNLSYDLNGNILSLNRKGENGANMDQLSYEYGAGTTPGNQLQAVSDAGALQAGFMDGNIGSTDYVYDLNGNMIVDKNKGITAIAYNHLNLPDKVTKSTGDYVKYIYDASGRKLSQEVRNTSNSLIKRTDYIGDYLYENDIVEFINHEEGRITKSADDKQLIPSPQLVPNGDASSTAGYLPMQSVVITSETLGAETYLKVVSNQATSTPGFTSDFINVKPGKNYQYRFKGYRTASAAYLYVIGDVGSNIVWSTKLIPSGAASEDWVFADFTVPANVTRIKVGVLWNPVTVGDVMYANKIELYEIDPVNGMYTEVDVAGALPSEYQYHLKDHLGNVRLTFTSKVEEEIAKATIETENENDERANFLKYDDIRRVNFPMFDHTTTGTTQYAMRLNGTTSETYGLARSVAVMPGDKIKAEVFAKYLDTNQANWTAALTDLVAAIASGTTAPGTVIDGGTYGGPGGGSTPFASPVGKSTEPSDVPKAYLNWLVFDKNFVPLASKSGFRRISSAAMENGVLAPEGVPHEKLESPLIEIAEPGYVYIYLSNEEPGKEVYFDDFSVTHTKSPVIQSDDYYPFGLTFNSYSRENSTPNKFKFQGQEHIDDLGLGWDSFKWRNHQPDIGRFFNVDPLADKYVYNSPYAFSENRVINGRELEGLEWVQSVKGSIVTNTVYLKVSNSANLSPESVKLHMKNIANQVNKSFQGNSDDGKRTYRTNVVVDYKSKVNPKSDFYVDFVEKVEGGSSPHTVGKVDTEGDTQKNRIQILVSLDHPEDTTEEGISRTGAHELGHTGGLGHPVKEDKDKNGIKLEGDNLMRQSQQTNGTTVNSKQLDKINENIEKQKKSN